ncbi:hypothetical protein RB597_009473 [Gaeumannomyces tritici]
MSHHCHDEHGDDDHHHHHAGGAEHDHSDDITPALQNSLLGRIDFDHVITLNEAEHGSGAAVARKDWAARLDPTPELASDADEQLLMHVPFTGQVKLHSVLLRTSDSAAAPRTLRLFVNPPETFDFSSAEEDREPAQELELSRTSEVQELPVKRAKFAQVARLALFFPDNFGDGDEDVTRISYIGFKGEWMQLGRAPANILYESAANPSDHALKGTSVNQMDSSGIGGRGPGV